MAVFVGPSAKCITPEAVDCYDTTIIVSKSCGSADGCSLNGTRLIHVTAMNRVQLEQAMSLGLSSAFGHLDCPNRPKSSTGPREVEDSQGFRPGLRKAAEVWELQRAPLIDLGLIAL